MTYPRVALRRLAILGSGHTPSRSVPEYWEDCTVPWFTLADVGQVRDDRAMVVVETKEAISELGLANSAATIHSRGTVVLSRTASVGFSAILGRPMATSQDFATWTCGPRLEPRFLLYCLRGLRDEILGMRQGSTHQTIYMPDIERIVVPLPMVSEQVAIADYLDTETARIDALVDALRRIEAVLAQRSDSVVEDLVLGLGRNGERSRTGWFVRTPVGWEETQLRHVGCEVQTGPFGSQLHADDYVPDGWPVVNPANLVDGAIVAIERMAVSDEKRAELSRHILEPSDIVFGRRGSMGRAGLVGPNEAGWLCGTGSLRLRLTSAVLTAAYLKLLIETSATRNYLELTSVGTTMDNLNADIVLSMPVLVPPVDVQTLIVEKVIHARATGRSTAGALTRQVALLQERKQALITAAVTGQLDIPGVAA